MGLLDNLLKYMEPLVLSSGDRPGKGIYICQQCRHAVRLDHDSDDLPACPLCSHTEYL